MSEFYAAVYAVVADIPAGKVATYGQIARLSGRPRAARQVGYALAALADRQQTPWHRVVNAKGEVSARATPDYEQYQRILLQDEGVEFDPAGRINLAHYAWQA